MLGNLRIWSAQLGILLAVCLAWEWLGRRSSQFFFVLGTPTAVWSELVSSTLSGPLLRDALVTGGEAAAGLVLGSLLGSVMGLTLWYSRVIARVTHPFIVAASTVPVYAFAPLMIVWFGVGIWMKIALATFATVFLSFSVSYRGAESVSREYVEILQGMDASRHQIFSKVIVPGSFASVLQSMRMNVGLALLGAFIGEVIAADRGLGYYIVRASGLYNVPRALAGVICVTLLALILDRCASAIENRRFAIVQLLSVPAALRKSS